MIRAKYAPYLFLLPAVALLIIFKVYPIALGLKNSLFAPGFIADQPTFVGIDNYTYLFSDSVFWKSVYATLFFNVFVNPLQIVLAFLLALLLNSKIKGVNLFRSLNLVPIAVSLPIACVLWSIMLNPEQGVVNSLLVALGQSQQPFLTSKDQAMWVIMAIATWKGVGYWAVFLLAGLQEVPASLYEAADIDGAGKWQQFRNITFPLMKRPLTFVTVADTVTNFLLFAPMYILTKGGPENSTNVLMQESFSSAFVYSDPGRASAIVILLLILILCIIGIQFRLLRSSV
ncbi:carbohydrate ABC transporter permease [Paenibacillus thalictri]|uniref:Sugar ABC transporter permease n=1 Tax=Paenibacillus thalictri TaxID=2527873 RepID=A0A4V2J399_9BACL|nr:sugar ABC transporter permease [Paenibacillus thalictri]TBL70768.1 sugar ABC transporter permease [Paenibacillus thalictri]